MGVVYKAIDPLIERTVAIKTIKLGGEGGHDAEVIRRIFLEAKSAGVLNHPNIVTVYDVGQAEGIAYIAMEFLEGKELKQLLVSGHRFTYRQIAQIVADIADALSYAHEKGIIHRDIKPANIMVVRGNVPKLADFGIALASRSAGAGRPELAGSPRYMSPEQIEGKRLDGRSDVFSLGAVLYELLTGRPPFDGKDITSVVYQVLHEMPPPPQSIAPSTPLTLAKVVAKALAKNPDDRYQTGAEMAAELRRFQIKMEARAHSKKYKDSTEACPDYPGPSVVDSLKPADLTVMVRTQLLPWAVRWRRLARTHIKWVIGAGMISVLASVSLVVWVIASRNAARQAVPLAATTPAAMAAADPSPAPTPAPLPAEPVPVPKPPEADPQQIKPAAGDTKQKPADGAAKPEKTDKADKSKVAKTGGRNGNSDGSLVIVRGEGMVMLAISPWGEVFVDGIRQGVSPPLTQLKLTAGRHNIEVRNGDSPPFTQSVDVTANESQKIRHKFQ